MFSLGYDKEDDLLTLCLTFSDNGMKLKFSPEAPVHVDIAESGEFNSKPGNGECSFTWNPDYIIFIVGKYGDGQGGHLKVDIPNSRRIMRSLHECLTRWNDLLSDREIIPSGSGTYYSNPYP